MLILLVYVATYVPYSICMIPPTEEITAADYVDVFVDILFGFDLIINFLSSYEDPVTGLQIVNMKLIAKNYI